MRPRIVRAVCAIRELTAVTPYAIQVRLFTVESSAAYEVNSPLMCLKHRLVTIRSDSPASRSRQAIPRMLAAVLGGAMLLVLLQAGVAEAKRKPEPKTPPDLRIISVTASPESYSPGNGTLEFAIEVELPKDIAGDTILEVSSLISSPSKRSMRFLSSRQPVDARLPSTSSTAMESPESSRQGGPGESTPAGGPEARAVLQSSAESPPPRIAVTLTWDGTDQTKQLVEHGRYSYEVRAKLLAVGEKGPRTQMVSWPKRGTLEIK